MRELAEKKKKDRETRTSGTSVAIGLRRAGVKWFLGRPVDIVGWMG